MNTDKCWGRSPAWYLDARERDLFEAAVRHHCPDVEAMIMSKGYVLRFSVDVDHYERRRIEVVFVGTDVAVFADGPRESKHRYTNGALCMWYPSDPVNRRWVHNYGAECLIEVIRRHLFLEAYWRETDHWVAEEAPHNAPRAGRKTIR